MQLKYDAKVDAASVVVGGPIEPGGQHSKDRLDEDRFVRYSDRDGAILQYEFLNVRRHGVRVDDLEHREELTALFRDGGFPVQVQVDPATTKDKSDQRGLAAS